MLPVLWYGRQLCKLKFDDQGLDLISQHTCNFEKDIVKIVEETKFPGARLISFSLHGV
jgi:hypothetical protein